MANLNKNFQSESFNQLLEYNSGVTRLLKAAFARWNYQPDFSEEECKSFETVLSTQEDAQEELSKRIKTLLSNFDFDNRHDIKIKI